MRLSWNEVRVRAAAFAEAHKDDHYEKGQTQTFYNEFFAIFEVKASRVASFEHAVKLLGGNQGFIDLLWRGKLLVEQKSAGRDLLKAQNQAFDYIEGLKDADRPRYVLMCDFQSFHLIDLETRVETQFALSDLPQYVEHFGFIMGVEKRVFEDGDPVNIKAAEQMGHLHDALKESGYEGHNLERLLVRLLFCLFAEDTGIFNRWSFQELIEERTKDDGSDLGMWLAQLFQTLDTPENKRQKTLDEDLARFPYVNGDLFGETLPIPAFNGTMRDALIGACRFEWDKVSPAIFGSLFQSVMLPKERRAKGAHYTSEKNILKLIKPLFLDDLWTEFETIKARKTNRQTLLEAFHTKLSKLVFFDPACGCGNFLVITYREIRVLEIEVLKLIHKNQKNLDILAKSLSKVDVDQVYGIEIDEFPARIAEVAMWMMDHIMNNRLSFEFGQVYARIPLKKAAHIKHGDALDLDWSSLCPPDKCSFVLGNPPFIGAKFQSAEQRQQIRNIARLSGSGGTLDYVCGWFLKAADYVKISKADIAFVTTNSITQGEQVAQLWPLLFEKGLEIAFAHRTFAWASEARGKAAVHVVIIGLTRKDREREIKRLYTYDDIQGEPSESQHKVLTAYLTDGANLKDRHVVVKEVASSLLNKPKFIMGSQPIDDGNYIFSSEEMLDFISKEPASERLFFPFIGAFEYLNGKIRYILIPSKSTPNDLRMMPLVLERMAKVKKYRAESDRTLTRTLSAFPEKLSAEIFPTSPFLCMPEVSSERRDYMPIGWLEPPIIPTNKLKILTNATLDLFSILTSAMHMAWMRTVTGRMKSDYMYSVGVVYNTFPWPDLNPKSKAKLDELAQAILEARAAHQGATLADLYDPITMPANLRKAHQANDKFVDSLYRKSGFASDRERVEHLFGLYEALTQSLLAKPKTKRKT